MHKASQSRAQQMEDDEMEQGCSPVTVEEGIPQTDAADADGEGRPAESSTMAVMATSSPSYMSDFLSHEATPTRVMSQPPDISMQTWPDAHMHPPHNFMDTSAWAADGLTTSIDHYSTHTNSYPQPSLSLPQNWHTGGLFPQSHQPPLYPHLIPSNQAPQFIPQHGLLEIRAPQLVPQQFGGQHGGLGGHYGAARTGGLIMSPHLAPLQLHGGHGGLGHQYAASRSPIMPNSGLDPNMMAALSRPASAHGSNRSGPSPVPCFQGHLPPISAITHGIPGDVSGSRLPFPQGSSAGGPVMTVIPPTPADLKGKGKQRETDVPPIHSNPDIDGTVSDSGSKPSSPSTGAISKSNLAHLDELWPKIEQSIANASETTGLPADRITKLLGRRLGLNVRGSTLWNSYQSFFADHIAQELERIGAQAEYDNATSAQKPAIVSRAQAAFKADHEKDAQWVDILQTWDTYQTVKKGCKGQSYTTREAKFDAMNNKVISYVSYFSIHQRAHADHRLFSRSKARRFKTASVTYLPHAALSKMIFAFRICHLGP